MGTVLHILMPEQRITMPDQNMLGKRETTAKKGKRLLL